MLRLNKIYSNKENIFPTIKINDGLNVVFASVTTGARDKASHSLGKTTLVELINFLLLKQVSSSFFLKKECFDSLVFFLEIQYSKESYLTIRRSPKGKIFLNVKNIPSNLSDLDKDGWDYFDLGLDKAKSYVNQILNLDVIDCEYFHFRSGLRYSLRKQTQYEDTFKVNTSREADSGWKPYLSGVLGINPVLVRSKYEANTQVESIKTAIKQVKALPQESTQSLDAEIAQLESLVERMQREIDDFDFRKTDMEVSEELVKEVSINVSNLNKKAYEIDQKLVAIRNTLGTEFSFDIDKVKELFSEVEVYFPEKLSNSYDDLIELNTQMSSGRKQRLKKTQQQMIKQKEEVQVQLSESLQKQQNLASVLVQEDAFKKFKLTQSRVAKEEARLAVLKERLDKLDSASILNTQLDSAKLEQTKVARELDQATRIRDNQILKKAVQIFGEIVKDVLGISAFFYTKTNSDGNIEFKIGLEDQTSVNDGFSYTRVLSSIFDMTLLILHSENSFYRFCYHDGLLESLDDRVKIKLLKKMRELSKEHHLQFIISVLDSDMPLDENSVRQSFSSKEVVRELHDGGSEGRLFRMAAF